MQVGAAPPPLPPRAGRAGTPARRLGLRSSGSPQRAGRGGAAAPTTRSGATAASTATQLVPAASVPAVGALLRGVVGHGVAATHPQQVLPVPGGGPPGTGHSRASGCAGHSSAGRAAGGPRTRTAAGWPAGTRRHPCLLRTGGLHKATPHGSGLCWPAGQYSRGPRHSAGTPRPGTAVAVGVASLCSTTGSTALAPATPGGQAVRAGGASGYHGPPSSAPTHPGLAARAGGPAAEGLWWVGPGCWGPGELPTSPA